MKNVRADDWTAELAIVAGNVIWKRYSKILMWMWFCRVPYSAPSFDFLWLIAFKLLHWEFMASHFSVQRKIWHCASKFNAGAGQYKSLAWNAGFEPLGANLFTTSNCEFRRKYLCLAGFVQQWVCTAQQFTAIANKDSLPPGKTFQLSSGYK